MKNDPKGDAQKKVIYIRADEHLHDLIVEMAKADKRSVSNMAEVLLEKAVKKASRRSSDSSSSYAQ